MMVSDLLPNGKEVERSCPRCRVAVKLVVRTNRQNETQFLGCPNWPECDYTEPIPEYVKLKAQGQPTLF